MKLVLLIALTSFFCFFTFHRRRDTDDKSADGLPPLAFSSFTEEESDTAACPLVSKTSKVNLPSLWCFQSPWSNYWSDNLTPSQSFAYPAIAIFTFFAGCVLLHRQFYNLLLWFVGVTWAQWEQLRTKCVIPSTSELHSQTPFKDSFDKDNPQLPYHRPPKGIPTMAESRQTKAAGRLQFTNDRCCR